MQVPIAQKFRDLDEASIEEAIRSLSQNMHNSSLSTRSTITFCLTVGSANLQHILKHGEKYKIMDKGFVWILPQATGDVESTVKDVTAIPKGHFRRLYAGFLNFDGVVLPDKIHKAIETADHDTMASSELNKWGAKAKGTSWKDEVYSKVNSGVGGSGNVYTYDAVWATAIGLASAMQANDMKNVHEHIRSGGGKGSFESASGKVRFDEVGDRSYEGLTFSLSNLIPPAAADEAGFNWSTFEFSGAYSWQRIGTWEASSGFTRVSDTSVVPYWTGGMRTWTPPSDAFENPQSEAGPSAPPPPPPTIITKEVIEKAQPVNLLAVVLPTVAIVLVLVLVAYCFYKMSIKPRDDGAEQFQQDLIRLRQRLKLTKQDGYILSTENNMWASSKSVVIPKAQIDSIVRMSRLEPFDTNVFDAFCVVLADNEYSSDATGIQPEESRSQTIPAADATLVLNSFKAAGAGEQVVGSKFGSVDMDARQDKQLRLVKEWLLELSSAILAQLSVEHNDEHSQAATGMGDEQQERRRAGASDTGGSTGTRNPRSVSRSISSVFKQKFKTQQKLYAYFVKYVLAVRIWRDDSFALFKELKKPVQVLMNQLADKCHERFRELSLDADGQRLCNFFWLPHTGELDRSQAAMQDGSAHNMQTSHETRQDDDRVQAVRVHRGDAAEAQMERDTPVMRYALAAAGLQVDSDEAVFIMQLHRRGKLLNEAFRSTVIDALADTYDYGSPVEKDSRDFDHAKNYSSDHASGHVTISTPALASFQTDAIIGPVIASGQIAANASLSDHPDMEIGQDAYLDLNAEQDSRHGASEREGTQASTRTSTQHNACEGTEISTRTSQREGVVCMCACLPACMCVCVCVCACILRLYDLDTRDT